MKKFEECFREIGPWEQWTYKSGTLLKAHNPPISDKHGVYVIRAPEALGRVHGQSNVVYIGQSGGGKKGGGQGIWRRIKAPRGTSEKEVRRLIESKFAGLEFSIQCHFTQPGIDPCSVEARLLRAYLDEFFELPPANHKLGHYRELHSLEIEGVDD